MLLDWMLAGLFVLEIVVALAVRAAIRWSHWQRSYRARSACDVSFCLPCWFTPPRLNLYHLCRLPMKGRWYFSSYMKMSHAFY